MGLFSKLFGGTAKQGEQKIQSRKEKHVNVSIKDKRKQFEENLNHILENENGRYTLIKAVQPEEVEKYFGQEIYSRGAKYAQPDKLTYAVCKDGRAVLYIRAWEYYQEYNHTANRQIRAFLDQNSIRCLDFFYYLPNTFEYMADRIRDNLLY